MFTLLVILVWIAIAMIYLLQFQTVRDYKPIKVYFRAHQYFGEPESYLYCEVNKYTIFKFPFFRRLKEDWGNNAPNEHYEDDEFESGSPDDDSEFLGEVEG